MPRGNGSISVAAVAPSVLVVVLSELVSDEQPANTSAVAAATAATADGLVRDSEGFVMGGRLLQMDGLGFGISYSIKVKTDDFDSGNVVLRSVAQVKSARNSHIWSRTLGLTDLGAVSYINVNREGELCDHCI
jgi:hypothetical protein